MTDTKRQIGDIVVEREMLASGGSLLAVDTRFPSEAAAEDWREAHLRELLALFNIEVAADEGVLAAATPTGQEWNLRILVPETTEEVDAFLASLKQQSA